MKFYKNILVTMLLFGLNPVIAHGENTADSINFNGMCFNFRDNKPQELILTAYTGDGSDVVIPESIQNCTVTAIDNEVFKGNQNIRKVTLPEAINYLGSDVFRNSSLVSVNIPENLRIIPSYSFNNCSELETVVFHDNIAVMSNTAFKKTNISVPEELFSRVTNNFIPDSEENIIFQGDDWNYTIIGENGSIYACINEYKGNSTDIIIPDSFNSVAVEEVRSFAFKDVSAIKRIFFPETVRELNISFESSELEEIMLPDIDNIPDNTFMNCKHLKKINFQGNQKSFTIGSSAFENCPIDYIPYPVGCNNLVIGRSAFENTNISILNIDFVSEIGENAFSECKLLSYVELNDAYIKSRAFYNCSELVNAVISGNSFLEEQSFYDCRCLKNITLSSLNIPMVNAVYNCQNFVSINSKNAFDASTSDFSEDLKDFVFKNFSGADEVGFINLYVQAQAEKIIAENISPDMSDIQKIKIIHDWICSNTVYDSGLSGNRKNHNDASVLMNNSTVCEGYAKIANILYHTAGIESYYISGVNHAWNIVKAGNNYFHVDTTWDDGDQISYDWFMKSDNELRKAGDNHAEWSLSVPSSLHSFQGTVLPVCKYRMGDINKDNSINIADLVVMNRYILGADSIDADNYILSDLTFDGIIDSFDLVKMRMLIIEQN